MESVAQTPTIDRHHHTYRVVVRFPANTNTATVHFRPINRSAPSNTPWAVIVEETPGLPTDCFVSCSDIVQYHTIDSATDQPTQVIGSFKNQPGNPIPINPVSDTYMTFNLTTVDTGVAYTTSHSGCAVVLRFLS